MTQETQETQSPKPRVEVRPTGSYFEIDAEGYVVNPASVEKIQPEWRPVVDAAVGAYRDAYGERLRSVFLRGSVAKGEAVAGVSDLDSFAYVDTPEDELKEDAADEGALRRAFPFVQGVEMGAYPMTDIPKDSIILNQSVCVWGEPIVPPRLKPGKDLALHAPGFGNRMAYIQKFLAEDNPPEEIEAACTWFAKGILRTGFELTMERAKRYTRDLYRCYETFAEIYPEKEPEMRRVLELALNPTSDKEEIRGMVEGMGKWIEGEVKVVFGAKA